MKTIDNVTKRAILKLIPNAFRGMDYVKVKDGDKYTIIKVTYSVYFAKDKDTGDYILNRAGERVLNTTAYIGFADGTYTTSKGDTVISQLVSETGDYPDAEGVYDFDCNCPVKVITVNATYGRGSKAKQYPVWAFEPQ